MYKVTIKSDEEFVKKIQIQSPTGAAAIAKLADALALMDGTTQSVNLGEAFSVLVGYGDNRERELELFLRGYLENLDGGQIGCDFLNEIKTVVGRIEESRKNSVLPI